MGCRTPTTVWVVFLIVALPGLLSLSACSPDAAEHRANAERYLAEGEKKEAVLELRSALRIEPTDAETNFRIATILDGMGGFEDAAFYYRETYRLDPARSDAALAEARLIVWEEPELAEELIRGVLEREPANPLARVRLSELELIREDATAALDAAMVGVELAPDDYRPHVQLGIVLRAQVRELRSVGDASPEALFEQALAAFDRALELSPESAPPVELLHLRLERAMVFASWEGHQEEAKTAFRDMIEATEGSQQRIALDAAFRYARRTEDVDFRRWVLEYQRSHYPDAYGAWGALARLEEESGGSGKELLESLLELQPEAAEAHILYARHLARKGQADQAAMHLLEVADRVDDPASLLALAVTLKLQAGEAEAAKEVLTRLETEYPELPATEFARAQRAFASGRLEEAATLLGKLEERAPSSRVSVLLARVELHRQSFPAALAAIQRALALASQQDVSNVARPRADVLRLKAQIHASMRDWPGTVRTLRRLSEGGKVSLLPGDRILLARAFYGLGRPKVGKKNLESLLELTPPPVDALLEFGRLERGRDPERARAALKQAVERAPADLRPVALLARLELETGNPEAAWTQLATAIEKNPSSALLHLLRARLRASEGDLEAALGDARRALELEPGFAAATRLQTELLSAQGKVGEGIEALEALAAEGHLDPSGRVRLARMHMEAGNGDRAVELLEQALSEQDDLHGGKNDLAFLLASRGVDLGRAVQLAQEARSALPNSSDVADTLGFAYLRNGLPEAALPQFESAVELAEARGHKNPLLLYHLGLALQALERTAEAAAAIEGSLAVEGEHPGFPREQAQRELEALRSAEAGSVGSS